MDSFTLKRYNSFKIKITEKPQAILPSKIARAVLEFSKK